MGFIKSSLQFLRRTGAQGDRPPRTRMCLEAFEPRILHSVDVGPALLHDVAAPPEMESRILDVGGEFAPSSAHSQDTARELVFVDTRTPDYQALVDDIRAEAADGRSIDVVMLDARTDGIQQITDVLATRKDIAAIHVISHGTDGAVQLGSSMLDLQSLRANADRVGAWSDALAPGADLMIYGCDVAASAAGRALVDALAAITRADVAASRDLTGSAAAGGDWNLEYSTGRIEAAIAVDEGTQLAWTGVLNAAPVLSGAENLSTIPEDASPNAGTQVSALIAGHVTDADAGALHGIAVTATNNANGNWQYSLDAGGTWSSFSSPSTTNATLLRSTDFVRFVPNADWNGTVANGLTFKAWDQTSGTAGATADTTVTSATVRDNFSSVSYANNDGTASWKTNWVDDDGNPSAGAVQISGGRLQLQTLLGGGSINRQADLASASSATLTFSYDNQILLSLGGSITVQVSNNGGATFTTLATFSSGSNTGTGSFSADISAFMSANTEIQFVSSGLTVVQSLFVDNVQIAYVPASFSAATASSSITVTPVDDAPSGTDGTVTVAEDGTHTFTAAEFGYSDPEGDAFNGITVATLPVNGSLTVNGVAVTAGQSIAPGLVLAGKLQFTPAANGSGAGYASFTFQVESNGIGANIDTTPNTMTINVTAVNDAPGGTGNTVSTPEDVTHVFTVAEFGFTDPLDTPANNFLAVKIGSVAGAGSLTLNGFAVTAGQSITTTNIAAGKLVFTPAANASGTGYASFTFQVQDDGGGTDLDPTPRTMGIDVTAVNDPPAGTTGTVTGVEDTGYVFAAADFGFSDPSDSPANNFMGVRIASVPGAGALTLSGAAVTAGQVVSAADIAAGNLVFTPASDANGAGYASFTFQVQDDGGGADLDTTPRTLTIDVAAVNDAPLVATNAGTNVDEGTSVTITTADLRVTDVDSAAAQLAFTVTAVPVNGHLELTSAAGVAVTSFTQDDIDNGRLVYVHDGSETATDGFTFTVSDGSGGGIGSTNFSIAVNPVNDAPADVVPAAQNVVRDTPLVFSSANGNAISVSDADAGGATIQLTLSATNGTLTLASITGLAFATGSGTADASMQFSGTLASVNAALNGMTFNPGTGYIGTASLTMVTDDFGNTGAGGAQSASGTVAIQVLAAPPPGPVAPAVPPVDPTAPGVTPSPTVPAGPPAVSTTPLPSPPPVELVPIDEFPPVPGGAEGVPATVPAEASIENARSTASTIAGASTRLGRVNTASYLLPATQWLVFGDDAPVGVGGGSGVSIGFGGFGDGRNALQSPALIDALDRLREGLQEQSRADSLVVAASAAATLGLSVGYVLWLLRGGVLLSSMLTSIPAWRLVDPLPVLGRLDEDDEDGEDDSLESLVATREPTPDEAAGDRAAPKDAVR